MCSNIQILPRVNYRARLWRLTIDPCISGVAAAMTTTLDRNNLNEERFVCSSRFWRFQSSSMAGNAIIICQLAALGAGGRLIASSQVTGQQIRWWVKLGVGYNHKRSVLGSPLSPARSWSINVSQHPKVVDHCWTWSNHESVLSTSDLSTHSAPYTESLMAVS